jgi:maltose/moltooligosaccharide transporter
MEKPQLSFWQIWNMSFGFWEWLLFLPMVGVGIAWASILSMSYSILSAALPSNKMGIYMGIFNFFIVIPEILSSLVFGWVMTRFLRSDRMKAVILGGVCFLIAAILMQRVKEVVIKDESIQPMPMAEPEIA